MSTNEGQSAAMPSPFPPIADYGFLSDCHTGALVAPDGGVDWLCVPRFDSPSVFGSLLDREAGTFRFGPFGINVPTQRVYEAGTNVLVTTWKTPSGWVVVRDALTIGPTRGPDSSRRTPDRRPTTTPSTSSCARRSASTVRSRWSSSASRSSTTARSRPPGRWWTATGHTADATGAGVTLRLHTDMSIGIEGGRVRARHTLRAGDRVFCSLSWADGFAVPDDVDDADGAHRRHRGVLAGLARPGPDPRPPVARPDPALGAGDQGAHLHADGRDGRRAHDVVARDARRRAQLGLPVQLAARLHVHAAGAALAEPRLGGRRVHAVHRRSRGQRGRRPADHVRDRRPARPRRSRRWPTSAGTPAPAPSGSATARSISARTTCSAPPSTRSCCTPAAASASPAGSGRSSRRRPSARRPCGGSPTRASGRPAASRSTTCRPS